MLLAPGTVVGGKYRIERALARGGMGSVWIARHVQLGSPVALKFLDASLAASAAHRARFEREARAAANLKSPHVVHVMDYGFEGAEPYLVMELLDGEDLGQRLERVGRLSLADAARVFAQVAKALRRAHEAGIVHRDLKPANLFIARVEDEEVVKVLDFGIAKESGAILGDATKTGEVMGSPHYMSPEQVRAEKDIDARTDLWSLGIILYRAIVGELPFPGDQLGPVLAKILTDPTPVPSRVAPDLPPSIDAFIARALARDKWQRFQTVTEMVDAFHVAAGRAAAPAAAPFGGGTLPVAIGSGTIPVPFAPGATGSGPAVSASGPVPAPHGIGASGPHGVLAQSGPYGALAQSGPVAGPSGTGVGLAATAPPGARSSSGGAVVAIVVGLVGLLAVAGTIGFFVFRSSATDVVGGAGSGVTAGPAPEVASGASTVLVAPTNAAASSAASEAPTASAPATTSASAAVAVTSAPTAAAKPIASAPITKPAPATTKPTAPAKPTPSTGPATSTKPKWF